MSGFIVQGSVVDDPSAYSAPKALSDIYCLLKVTLTPLERQTPATFSVLPFVYLSSSFLVLLCDPLYSAEVKTDNNIVAYMYIYRLLNELESKADADALLCIMLRMC